MFEYDYEWNEIKKLGIELDKDKMIERNILMILTTVFEAAGWDINKLRLEWKRRLTGQRTL
jgi:hypothetical protein